jgi:hypothetical protein
MATTVQTVYGSSTAVTLTSAGLASDSAITAGRASTIITATGAIDYLVSGIVTTSSSGTLGTAKQVEIWTFSQVSTGYFTGLSTAYTGSDAANSPTQKGILKLLQIIPLGTGTSAVYSWGPMSIAQANGGIMPNSFGIFIVHNSCVALNAATGTQITQYQTVTFTSS